MSFEVYFNKWTADCNFTYILRGVRFIESQNNKIVIFVPQKCL